MVPEHPARPDQPAEPDPNLAAPEAGLDAADDAPPPPRKAPRWVFIALPALLAAVIVGNHLYQTGGPELTWVSDYDRAIAAARSERRKVLLYLYQAGDPLGERNLRELFQERKTREALANVICCQVVLSPGDLFGSRFGFRGPPLLLLLTPSEEVLVRLEGAPEPKAFFTYIEDPARRPLK